LGRRLSSYKNSKNLFDILSSFGYSHAEREITPPAVRHPASLRQARKGETMTATPLHAESVPAGATAFGVAAVFVPVSDPYASAQWYMQNFGLTPSPNTPLQPPMLHVILHCSGSAPGLFLLGCDNFTPALRLRSGDELMTFCLLVKDIESALSHLKANGVRLERDTVLDRGTCGLNVKCYDPDGNKFEIVQSAG